MNENLRLKAYKSIYDTFAKDCTKEFEFGEKSFESIVDKAFLDFIKGKTPVEKPFIIRTAGQSGSGKTTQLMPAILEGLKSYGENYVHIAVRKFAPYHPRYNQLLNEFGQGLIREKTNGFALMLLYRVIEKLIENKYNIFFEVTILENDFENNLLFLAKNHNYKINYNIIFCPKEISNYLIEVRKNSSLSLEKNRIVPTTTSNYFFDVLQRAIHNIYEMRDFFNANDLIVCWNMYDVEPVLVIKGKIENDDLLQKFNYYINEKITKLSDENLLLKAKKDFYKNNLIKFLNN